MSFLDRAFDNSVEQLAALQPQPYAPVLIQILDGLNGSDHMSPESAEWVLRDPALTVRLLEGRTLSPNRLDSQPWREALLAECSPRWALTSATAALVSSPRCGLQDWMDSLTSAHLCQSLARQLGYPDETEAYLAGLLHNVDRYTADSDVAPVPTQGRFSGVARLVEHLSDWPSISGAIAAQDEGNSRLAEALPLARVLRVARACAAGEQDSYRQAADLLPELTTDQLDQIRADAQQNTHHLRQCLGVAEGALTERDPAKAMQERLAVAVEGSLLLEKVYQRLQATETEMQVVEAAVDSLARQLALKQPFYLKHDPATGVLTAFPDERQPGLRVRVRGSNSAAAWALNSRVPVLFAARDTELVSLLDVQLTQQTGGSNIVAIPVGDSEIEGVLLGCLDRRHAARVERCIGYVSRFGRLVGQELSRVRKAAKEAAETASDASQSQARVRRALHEISNPLSIARNYLAIIGTKFGDGNLPDEEIRIIREELDRIPKILRTLTDDGRGGSRIREACHVNSLVGELARMGKSAIIDGKGVRITTLLEPSLQTVRTDPGKLKQLLLNLVLNAIDASPSGAEVRLETGANVDLHGKQQAIIVVRDQGSGIPPERLSRLYEPAESVKGGEHAGLGLAIVKTLAAELDVSVACTSGVAGTAFQVAFAMG